MPDGHPQFVGDAGHRIGGEAYILFGIVTAGCFHQADGGDLKGVLPAVEQINRNFVHCIGNQAKILFNEGAMCIGQGILLFHKVYSSCNQVLAGDEVDRRRRSTNEMVIIIDK